MTDRTPLGTVNSMLVTAFWQRFLSAERLPASTSMPEAWPFGDSVELANKLIALVLHGPKRATAGLVAEFEAEGIAMPQVGDYEIVTDGHMTPRAVLRLTDVRIGPLSSVDDQFAYDEGEGDRSRAYWVEAHTRVFSRTLPHIGVEFHPDIETIFQRFEVVYQES